MRAFCAHHGVKRALLTARNILEFTFMASKWSPYTAPITEWEGCFFSAFYLESMQHDLLFDIGIAVIAATVSGLIAHWFRQPIILGYLIAGALVGPELGFKFIKDGESIELISEMGLILLLFIIGLELNIKDVLASG